MRRFARELAIGARLTLEGGRESLARVAMTAVGVGLGVVVLLGAASVPQALDASDQRNAARTGAIGEELAAGHDTLLVGGADTTFRGDKVRGRLLQAEGPDAPVPPGLDRLPGPGELVVSPALARRLRDPDASLLRERLAGRVVGTIGDAGLVGPAELAYYAGSDTLAPGERVQRIDAFGGPRSEPLDPVLYLLVTIIVVVLLAPIAVFIASAVRFGGEARDRRLAAVRLLGADRGMALRIAAGESLVGALGGIAVGAALFLAARPLVERLSLWDLSVFATDVRPSGALALLIVVLVPAAAVAVTLFSLRRIVIEPLGVVRRSMPRKRRIAWRLALPVAGFALLVPLLGMEADDVSVAPLIAGMLLLLGGVTALLPWLVESVVGRLRGGSLPWQLATRRLQLESGSAVRAVSGIAVAIAGAVALQMVFSSVERSNRAEIHRNAADARAFVELGTGTGADRAAQVNAALRGAPGVRTALPYEETEITRDGRWAGVLLVAGCDELRYYAELGRCRDGDAFVFRDDTAGVEAQAVAGGMIDVDGRRWRVPAAARTVAAVPEPIGWARGGVLATPRAVPQSLRRQPNRYTFFSVDGSADALEQARNAVAAVDPLAVVQTLDDDLEPGQFALVRRGLFAAASLVLVLIGASLLIGLLEQLRDRRRLLASLVAVGARRSTLSWSVLIQTAIPVTLGVGLATGAGIALGALLLEIVSEPYSLDVGAVAAMAGAGAGVVLLVTMLTLPALWRLMRPEGLRTE
jgi:hypothetical protein